MKNPRFSHAFQVVAALPEPLEPLKRLAANFRWTWDHETRALFQFINQQLWHATGHNPVLFINSLGSERLEQLSTDAVFLSRLQDVASRLDEYLAADTWFDQTYPGKREQTTIAYFCAEFGISESLPIYSGGLGVLAGDHLKAASDLGLPLVGVGLLYNRGYFRQRLTPDGWQQEIYPAYDFYQMPLQLMRDSEERPIRILVEFPDRTVNCHVWKAEVGRVSLYLLDSNVLENAPADQDITDTLYGGDEDMRIRQEMILGIGGMRALKACGIEPTVCHMNEGHAAFLTIERLTQFMSEESAGREEASRTLSAGNVFTTHTPVPAGFDLFTPQMLDRYLGRTLKHANLSKPDLLKMGRMDPGNEAEAFNMALLAMNNSNHINGVSQLHANVSRSMFAARWPGFIESEAPIEGITNGVHTSTWVSSGMAELFDRYLGVEWRTRPDEATKWAGIESIPEDELWSVRERQRATLVHNIRRRFQGDLEQRTLNRPDAGLLNAVLDPRILTIGFARRFATYKRGSLMLHDRDRLKRLLFHEERPIQIIIAGKAHPRDDGGKKIIQDLVRFITHEGVKARMVFLEDYDMRIARMMVQGVDVWLNNPRRPFEASGTSGMKVVPNGGLNCSILDGWWDEGFDPSLGWAIGDRDSYNDDGHQDWLDSTSLYDLLENEIAPLFYHRVEGGIPFGWVRMMKASIQALAPQFSTSRMVRDYATKFYMPAAEGFTALKQEGLRRAREAQEWSDKVRLAWPEVRILSVSDDSEVANQVGREITITAQVRLGKLSPSEVEVQAVVGKIGSNRELSQSSFVHLSHAGSTGDASEFVGTVSATMPGYQGYTIRVMPKHPDVEVPHELSLVAWE